MRVQTFIWPLLFLVATATSVPADIQTPLGLEPDLASTREKVPGDSPAYYNRDPSSDILAIEILELIPNPPKE